MKSTWFLLFAIFCVFCLSTLPGVKAQFPGAQAADSEADYGEDEYVADDDEEEVEEDEDEEVDADEEEDEEEEEADDGYTDDDDFDELTASGDVLTFSLLPDYPDKRMITGEKVVVLANFVNKGDSSFNLTEVGAYFHSPYDFNYYMHNFTVKSLLSDDVVEPHTQFSVEYTFTPEVNLIDGSLDFTMSAFIDYNSTGEEIEQFRSVVFNSTITIIEAASTVDIRRFYTGFLVLAGIGLLIYIGVGVFNKTKKNETKFERGTSMENVDDSWEFKKYEPRKLSSKRGRKRRN